MNCPVFSAQGSIFQIPKLLMARSPVLLCLRSSQQVAVCTDGDRRLSQPHKHYFGKEGNFQTASFWRQVKKKKIPISSDSLHANSPETNRKQILSAQQQKSKTMLGLGNLLFLKYKNVSNKFQWSFQNKALYFAPLLFICYTTGSGG